MPNSPDDQRTITARLKRLGIVGSQALALAQSLDPESVESWSDDYLAFVVGGGSVSTNPRTIIDGGTP